MVLNTKWESSASRLFRRCVQCPDTQPVCPSCAEDQMCSLISETCDECAYTQCVARSTVHGAEPTEAPEPKSSAAGPIAGAVVGGLVVIAIATFLIWKFCIAKRRKSYDESTWVNSTLGSEKDTVTEGLSQHKHRASTHTVASFASIPIAYIPGVTNRSIHSTPDLVPPVPTIPATATGGSGASTPHMDNDDRHFFMPSDIRNSTMTANTDRNSVATRNSVASTIYRNNAVVSPVPAQMVSRGKATTVSVKSKTGSPSLSRSTTPPVPSLPSNNSVSSFQSSLNTKSSIVGRMGQPKPVQITRKGSAPQHSPIYELDGSGSEASYSPYMSVPDRRYDNASPQYSHHSSTFEDGSSDEEYGNSRSAQRRLIAKSRQSEITTIQEGSPISPAELSSYRNSTNIDTPATFHQQSPSLNQMIEEAARNASRDPLHGGLGTYGHEQPETSPFSDSHATRTP